MVNENFYFKTSISIMIRTGAFTHVAEGVDDLPLLPEEYVCKSDLIRVEHCQYSIT